MEAEHKQDILNLLNTTEGFVFMSNIATRTDIEKSETGNEYYQTITKKGKESREGPDLAYNGNMKKAVSVLQTSLKESEMIGARLKNCVFFCMQEGVKVRTATGKHGEKIIENFHGTEYFEELGRKLFQFPVEKNRVVQNTNTEAFIRSKLPDNISLLKQSLALNYLSSATESQIKCSGGKLGTWFSTRFPDSEKAYSFRNKVIFSIMNLLIIFRSVSKVTCNLQP